MQNTADSITPDSEARELVAALQAERTRRASARRPLPGWARISLRVMPWVLLTATLLNLAIGVLAIVAPLALISLGPAATDWIYRTYSLICPQRPSHTTFVAGEPMAMEQRMVAMYVGFGIAGLVYALLPHLRRPCPSWLAMLGILPALIDVALSTAGIRPSTMDSRLWTGALASLAVVWWAYPRFEAMLRRTRAHTRP